MLEVQGHRVIVGIDRSGSMDEMDCDGQSRFNYLKEKLIAFVGGAITSAAFQKVFGLFFNNNVQQVVFANADEAKAGMQKFGPGGSTATHLVIEKAFQLHLSDPTVPTMLFLVTDGHPDDESAVNKEIISVTKRLDKPEDFRIMILTVGQRNKQLTAWLEQLDSELGPQGAKFDIVGQNNLNEVDFQEAAAELIGSTTTNSQAAAGDTAGKTTHRVD